MPFVMQPTGYTSTPVPSAFSMIYLMVSGVSQGGFVLGIARTPVTPPASAAAEPVLTSSLWVWPGSRKCTCISNIEGMSTRPVPSMT